MSGLFISPCKNLWKFEFMFPVCYIFGIRTVPMTVEAGKLKQIFLWEVAYFFSAAKKHFLCLLQLISAEMTHYFFYNRQEHVTTDCHQFTLSIFCKLPIFHESNLFWNFPEKNSIHTAKRKLERLQFSTSSSFLKIGSACSCKFKAYCWTLLGFIPVVFWFRNY